MSRKRNSSDSDGSAERIPNKVQRVSDPYCWLCHRRDTDQRCSTCNLSYHLQCIGVTGPKIKQYKCELCIRMREAQDDYAKRQVDTNEFHKMLAHVLSRIYQHKSFPRLKTFDDRVPLNGGPALINPFNLEIVSEKIDDKQYKSTVEFLKDICQIRHNAEIVSTDGMKRLTIARQMEKWCAKEVYDIEMCGPCFGRAINSGDWFTEVCDPPHLLVWAKVAGYPWWPAKLIGITTTANRLDVRFFGDHDMATVLAQECLLYPSKNPNRRLDAYVEKDLCAAMKEAKKYTRKIEEKYDCTVQMFDSRTTLVVKRIREILMKWIPNVKLPPDFKLKRKPNYLRKTQCHRANVASTSPQPPHALLPSSLTPPPSPPIPIPSTSSSSSQPPLTPKPASLLIVDGKRIKHSMSRIQLQKMHRFALEIRPCDNMPEFIAAFQKLNNINGECSNGKSIRMNGLCANDVEDSTVVNLTTDDDDQPNDKNGGQMEYVEVDVVMDGDINEDDSLKNLYYSASDSSHANDSRKHSHSQTNDNNQPNDDIETISIEVNTADIHAVDVQSDITDDIELPSPPMEPIHAAAIADTPLPTSTLLEYRNQLTILKAQLQNEFKPEIERLNAIINGQRSTITQHIEKQIDLSVKIENMKGDQMEMRNEIERLKKLLLLKDAEYKKLQLQHAVDVQKAIEDTKPKQWCVNCKKEALITQYKLPVCSTDCLFVVFDEGMMRAERAELSEPGN